MSLDDEVAFLQRVPSFSVLGTDALRVLAIGADARHLASGAVLFYAGELADSGFVVQDGSLTLDLRNFHELVPSEPIAGFPYPREAARTAD